MIYVGIDVAKSKHDCVIIDDNAQILEAVFTIANSNNGFQKLLKAISIHSNQKSFDVTIALEATGHYSDNILHFLESYDFNVTVFNPLHTNLVRKSKNLRKIKTDKVDAYTLASMLIETSYITTKPIPDYIHSLKSLTRSKARLVHMKSQIKVSIHRMVDIIFPELHSLVSTIHSASVYALFSQIGNTQMIANTHLTKFSNILHHASKGRFSKDKALAIREAAISSIGSNELTQLLEIQQLLRLLDSFETELKITNKAIDDIMDSINSPITSIPGIGNTLGAVILAEIESIDDFETPAKLLAFAGMEPSIHQSGKFTSSHAKMVKRGSKYLRKALMMAAQLVSMRSNTFKNFKNKKNSEGKHHFVTLSHVARKLVRVIFHLLRTNSHFVEQSL